jgi:hypothetical protein
MLEISNVRVYDLKESVIACRNAMRITPPEYTEEEFKQSLSRAISLAKCGGGSGHTTFRCGIRVSFDVKYPNYISPELQRYHFLDIVTSSSKMHRLLKMDLDKACNKYVGQSVIDDVNNYIKQYNYISEHKWEDIKEWKFLLRNKNIIVDTNKEDALYHAWMEVLSNTPLGLELFMRISTNYEQLATIYKQRKHHKLKEDWGAFCKFIEELPYAKELIIQ